jgi:hypothetical protein
LFCCVYVRKWFGLAGVVGFGTYLRSDEMVWFGRRICIPVKKRFPTLQHLVESGILNDNEREIIQKIDEMYIQVKNAEPEFLNFLRGPRIDSKESIPPGCVAWWAGTTTLFLLGS